MTEIAAFRSDALVSELRTLIEQARGRVAQTVNSELVWLYWQIGHRLRTEVLDEDRAAYGKQVVAEVGRSLTADFGRGFDKSSLYRMMRFAEVFPDREIVAALRPQLSWTHLRELIAIDDPLKRQFYIRPHRPRPRTTHDHDHNPLVAGRHAAGQHQARPREAAAQRGPRHPARPPRARHGGPLVAAGAAPGSRNTARPSPQRRPRAKTGIGTEFVLHRFSVMANLTITVDDEVLKRARIRALEQGTSVNAILADRLRAYAGEDEAQLRATRSLFELAEENSRAGGQSRAVKRDGRRFSRDELHERR